MPRLDRPSPMLHVAGCIGLLYLTLPVLVVGLMSFSESRYLAFPPPGWSTEWYAKFFSDPIWTGAMLNSFRLGLCVAAIATPIDRERVYRITVKPVVGDISEGQSGLKVLVGYDVLAMVRPGNPVSKISGGREGRTLIVRNEGNSSAELLNGKQCGTVDKSCSALAGKRLYSGAEWRLQLPGDGPVEYSVKLGDHLSTVRF